MFLFQNIRDHNIYGEQFKGLQSLHFNANWVYIKVLNLRIDLQGI